MVNAHHSYHTLLNNSCIFDIDVIKDLYVLYFNKILIDFDTKTAYGKIFWIIASFLFTFGIA